MLYTGKGDEGTTKTFGCDQRISKSSSVAEALGTLDEINSFLGLCKVKSGEHNFTFEEKSFSSIVHTVQSNLFIVQAELAGAPKEISKEKVKEIEDIINNIEKELPPITSFFISGGSEVAALFDVARTLARRAERRVVGVCEEHNNCVGTHTRAYMNRLSSLLYALARYANYLAGEKEEAPDYK
ncbi:MAG: cob(I)yrinic acid a,c-diamide adenosyltransferase [Candidatus Paceibacterota bacterium]